LTGLYTDNGGPATALIYVVNPKLILCRYTKRDEKTRVITVETPQPTRPGPADDGGVDQLDAGDVLLVTRLDRLARSKRDLLNTLAAIGDPKAGFRSLGDAWRTRRQHTAA
jgi:hypothetical protein